MSLGLIKNPKYHQGFYNPVNSEKYIGKTQPIYRSGIELKFFIFLDNNPKVIKWSSEPLPIPYFDDTTKKWRKYYVDNYVEILEGTVIKKYLIEIKPIKDTKEPENKKYKKKATLLYEQCTFKTNNCKWAYASKFCKDHKLDFLLLGYSKTGGFEHIKLNYS